MMKITKTKFIFILTVLFGCAAQKTVEADFPSEMLPNVKAEYQKRFDKGQVLYNMNCAKCHNTKSGRKTFLPDFQSEQLKGYALRIANAQHEQNMPDSLVSEEELGIIMTFLMYKKKSQS